MWGSIAVKSCNNDPNEAFTSQASPGGFSEIGSSPPNILIQVLIFFTSFLTIRLTTYTFYNA
jgi:hypothetical protein